MVAKYGPLVSADWKRLPEAHAELLEANEVLCLFYLLSWQVMSFHAGAKRPARGNVLDRVRSVKMAASEPCNTVRGRMRAPQRCRARRTTNELPQDRGEKR